MEAGMGMRCWVLLVYVIVVPLDTRGQSQLLGPSNPRLELAITYGVQMEATFVHLEHLAPARGGKGAMRNMARQVDSGDTCTVSNILRCI